MCQFFLNLIFLLISSFLRRICQWLPFEVPSLHFLFVGLMRILRLGVVCKFFLFTEDCRKFNETLSIKAEMREFASILIVTRTKVDWTGIFTRIVCFAGRRKKRTRAHTGRNFNKKFFK